MPRHRREGCPPNRDWDPEPQRQMANAQVSWTPTRSARSPRQRSRIAAPQGCDTISDGGATTTNAAEAKASAAHTREALDQHAARTEGQGIRPRADPRVGVSPTPGTHNKSWGKGPPNARWGRALSPAPGCNAPLRDGDAPSGHQRIRENMGGALQRGRQEVLVRADAMEARIGKPDAESGNARHARAPRRRAVQRATRHGHGRIAGQLPSPCRWTLEGPECGATPPTNATTWRRSAPSPWLWKDM